MHQKRTAPGAKYGKVGRGWLQQSYCPNYNISCMTGEYYEISRCNVKAKDSKEFFGLLRNIAVRLQIDRPDKFSGGDESGVQPYDTSKKRGLVAGEPAPSAGTDASGPATGGAGASPRPSRKCKKKAKQRERGTRQTTTVVPFTNGNGELIFAGYVTVGTRKDHVPPKTISDMVKANPAILRNGKDLLVATPNAFVVGSVWRIFIAKIADNLDKYHGRGDKEWHLLIVDGHYSHLDPQSIVLAYSRRIAIVIIPPHSSAELQAQDVALFGPMKKEFASLVSCAATDPEAPPVSKDWTVEYLSNALHYVLAAKGATPAGAHVRAGFAATGQWDYTAGKMVDEKRAATIVAAMEAREAAAQSKNILPRKRKSEEIAVHYEREEEAEGKELEAFEPVNIANS